MVAHVCSFSCTCALHVCLSYDACIWMPTSSGALCTHMAFAYVYIPVYVAVYVYVSPGTPVHTSIYVCVCVCVCV